MHTFSVIVYTFERVEHEFTQLSCVGHANFWFRKLLTYHRDINAASFELIYLMSLRQAYSL